MPDTARQSSSHIGQIPSEEALRIAQADARLAYGDLRLFRITVALEDDGWHIDYSLRKSGMKGGGPHYIVDAVSGQIVSKRYEQ
jgi:hypothetical protein